jgi:hypothetical protein
MLGDGVGRDEYIGQKHSRFRIIGKQRAVGRRHLTGAGFGAQIDNTEKEANSDWPVCFECPLKTSHFLLVFNLQSHSFILPSRYGSKNTESGPASNKRVRHVPRYLPLVRH